VTVTRNRKLLLLLGVVAVAAVIVAVLVAVATTGGDDESASPTTTTTTQGGAAGADTPLLAGIPQSGITLGKASAPATLIEFVDPQCPYCAQWSRDAFPAVVRDFVRTGKVRLEYRGLHFIGPDSEKALRAVLAAGKQGKLFDLAEKLYAEQGDENSGWVTDALLRRTAATIPGLNANKMFADMSSADVDREIKEADELATRYQVEGTPAFALVKPPQTPIPLQGAALDAESFTASLASALGQ
jgi:protein-disulfide isomerase